MRTAKDMILRCRNAQFAKYISSLCPTPLWTHSFFPMNYPYNPSQLVHCVFMTTRFLLYIYIFSLIFIVSYKRVVTTHAARHSSAAPCLSIRRDAPPYVIFRVRTPSRSPTTFVERSLSNIRIFVQYNLCVYIYIYMYKCIRIRLPVIYTLSSEDFSFEHSNNYAPI